MPSANGFALEIDGHRLHAYWPAPFFVLITDDADDPHAPMLYHAESLEIAQRVRRTNGGTILDQDFNEVQS